MSKSPVLLPTPRTTPQLPNPSRTQHEVRAPSPALSVPQLTPLSPRRIPGNVFYVTGGASGLGLATVHHLSSLGAFVAILDMSTDAGEALEKELGSDKATFVRCDVRSEEDVVEAIRVVDTKWGSKAVGGVVHCGGIGMAGKVRSLPSSRGGQG